ncbi:biotin--[acetyl-CoA-carboxylase] ligase [Flavobacterium sp. Sd200]|uniref:biotin--[acetyl-CoA-carboxylase] ligase n=1 Tax=Flavobacterium sp. Sd200 TaxID=2692211 RepID=UPI00136D9240|nr:biotin--[acetyl-CoA-carboxylase] ligase [Flavobacterium sp. Sd200]MXN92505.1 biotin--[acetyl-CoA-carboxylase] ligase [Flavobacterium sp. Sd200]
MNIIKLNATNSTNDYLKQLVASQDIENFTVVTVQNQTAGRGQMGAQWSVESGKNLTFSVLVKNLLFEANAVFNLNVGVAVSIAQALEVYNIPQLSVKWPNDILAGSKKIGGVLIENSFKSGGAISSVIGIGLNVNQQNFDGLARASSLALVTGHDFDKEEIMHRIIQQIKLTAVKLLNNGEDALWQAYHDRLFKKGVPMTFESNGKRFVGIIQGVNRNGMLEVALEDTSIAQYAIKEVQLLY